MPGDWSRGSPLPIASSCGRSLPGGGIERSAQLQGEEPQGGSSWRWPSSLLSWLCQAPWHSACLVPHVSFPPRSSSGDSDAECPQESALRTLAPGPWGSPASSPEPSSPESESGGPGPRPSPVSSQEGSPQPRGPHWGSSLPEWTLDASRPSLLETDGAEPSLLEKEEAGETPHPGKEVKSEGPARTPEAGAVQPGARLTSTER